MIITLSRTTTNRLYTEGTMTVNGLPFSHTVEDTPSMLPTGIYDVSLQKQSKGPRVISIVHEALTPHPSSLTLITHGNVWKDANSQGHIIIGEPLIPGCVIRSRAAYNRLFERIEKCKTPIKLTIRNSNCKPNTPISHWNK